MLNTEHLIVPEQLSWDQKMMYAENHLKTGERLAYQTKLHRIIFVVPALLFVLSLTFYANEESAVFGVIVLFVSLVLGLAALLKYITTEFVVTNKRILVITGLISRQSQEILLSKLERIEISQGITGRLFGFGSIVLIGIEGANDPYCRICDPMKFKKIVQDQAETASRWMQQRGVH